MCFYQIKWDVRQVVVEINTKYCLFDSKLLKSGWFLRCRSWIPERHSANVAITPEQFNEVIRSNSQYHWSLFEIARYQDVCRARSSLYRMQWIKHQRLHLFEAQEMAKKPQEDCQSQTMWRIQYISTKKTNKFGSHGLPHSIRTRTRRRANWASTWWSVHVWLRLTMVESNSNISDLCNAVPTLSFMVCMIRGRCCEKHSF